jgi:hypothetical protein
VGNVADRRIGFGAPVSEGDDIVENESKKRETASMNTREED